MGNERGSTTILRGFKVAIHTLDAYLCANGEEDTCGAPPFLSGHPDEDPISKLFHKKLSQAGVEVDKSRFRIVIPLTDGGFRPVVAYITYAWVAIYAHRELQLDEDLPVQPPAGFEELKDEVLSFADRVPDEEKMTVRDEGRMGLFAVHTHGIRGGYQPQELRDRWNVPQFCDHCDVSFNGEYTAFDERQKHRIEVHGVREPLHPLPDA